MSNHTAVASSENAQASHMLKRFKALPQPTSYETVQRAVRKLVHVAPKKSLLYFRIASQKLPRDISFLSNLQKLEAMTYRILIHSNLAETRQERIIGLIRFFIETLGSGDSDSY